MNPFPFFKKLGSTQRITYEIMIRLPKQLYIVRGLLLPRAPVLTVNGMEDGFDGFRIGVNGFENPMRDHKVTEFKAQVGTGIKLKMDDSGNILVILTNHKQHHNNHDNKGKTCK